MLTPESRSIEAMLVRIRLLALGTEILATRSENIEGKGLPVICATALCMRISALARKASTMRTRSRSSSRKLKHTSGSASANGVLRRTLPREKGMPMKGARVARLRPTECQPERPAEIITMSEDGQPSRPEE